MKSCSGLVSHNIILPVKIEIGAMSRRGRVENFILTRVEFGLALNNNFVDKMFIRIVYILVSLMDETINRDIIVFILDNNINSMIASLEKNPDINGVPIKANLFNPNMVNGMGEDENIDVICRMS